LLCRVDEYRPRDAQSPEKVTDGYAADLLMPRYVFAPRASAIDRMPFDSIGRLAEAFKTSLTATAIRLVDLDQFPGFVISHTPRGRKWFARAPSVPRHWFPREELCLRDSIRRPPRRQRGPKDRGRCLVRSSGRCAAYGSRANGPRRPRRDREPCPPRRHRNARRSLGYPPRARKELRRGSFLGTAVSHADALRTFEQELDAALLEGDPQLFHRAF
jgi:hypothetical protein